MDFSKFKVSDWLKIGGAVVFLVAGFLEWWGWSGSAGSFGVGFSYSFTGLGDYFGTVGIAWILLVAIGVLTFLSVQGIFKLPSNLPAPVIFLAGAVLATLLVLLRFFSDGFDTGGIADPLSRGIGAYLGLIADIAVVAGCVIGFQETGGNLKDLTDVNKMKSQFGGNPAPGGYVPPPGGMTPPPPPGMNPPPPPPPPGGSVPPPPPPR